YIWTNDGRNNPILNLKPNTNYEFIMNTMPEDNNEHELKITTMQGEEVAGDSVDQGVIRVCFQFRSAKDALIFL
ncbi:MAG: hypothetical protein ACRD47_14590, partial [Nitrososphaeraceae archaeon]